MAKETENWLKSAVIYEVFPRNHSVEGTFDEVCRDLERIRALGADIVWLMPIHPIGFAGRKGSVGSPYAISDYRKINEDLGNAEDLRRLIGKAHELGLKIIIDVVYNHTAIDSVLASEHPEWFHRDASGAIGRKYEGWSDVLDLDYRHRELWDYLIETLKIWLDTGIDGFRCDVAPMVPLEFWKEARWILNRDKEVVWLAESVTKSFLYDLRQRGYTAHSDGELHEAFDMTYDYDGYDYLQSYFRGEGELKDYFNHLFVQETLMPVHAVKMRFLENHDIPRVAAIFSSKSVLMNWTLFYALLPGATLVYAGQEVCEDKQSSLFEKDPVDWENGDWDFQEYLKKVIGVTKQIKKRCDKFNIRELAKGIVRIDWRDNEVEFVSILNLEDRFGEIAVDFELSGQDLIIGCQREIRGIYSIEKLPILVNNR